MNENISACNIHRISAVDGPIVDTIASINDFSLTPRQPIVIIPDRNHEGTMSAEDAAQYSSFASLSPGYSVENM